MGNFNCVTVVTSKMYLANPRAPNSQVLTQSILIKFSTMAQGALTSVWNMNKRSN